MGMKLFFNDFNVDIESITENIIMNSSVREKLFDSVNSGIGYWTGLTN